MDYILSFLFPANLSEKLYNAVRHGDYTECRKLIKSGANIDEYYNYDCPLHFAARTNNFPICNLLVKSGADVNVTYAKEKGHNTPISTTKNPQIMKLLIKAGADLNGTCREFLQNPAIPDEIFHLAIEYGLNLNIINKFPIYSEPVFHTIVRQKRKSLYKLALEYGADPTCKCLRSGKTVFDIARENNDTYLLSLISGPPDSSHSDDIDLISFTEPIGTLSAPIAALSAPIAALSAPTPAISISEPIAELM
jgi:ankyrin repeat protein